MNTAIIGQKIRIIWMKDEPSYCGRTGVVERIDGIGQLHGTWGGLAVVPGVDEYELAEWEDRK